MEKIHDFEKELLSKAKQTSAGLRRNRIADVFGTRIYIGPEDLNIENYKRRKPLAAFNPGAFEREGRIYVFPRLIFDYYNYTSSIGLFSLKIEELLEGNFQAPLKTKIILWPEHLWEFLGCEDPRVTMLNEEFYLLYTGKGFFYQENEKKIQRDVLALAQLDSSFHVKKKAFFKIKSKNDEFIPSSMKDSAFITEKFSDPAILIRPEISGVRACWATTSNLENMSLDFDKMKPIMIPEKWEERVGWSTNTVKISEHEYLVGWHAIFKEDLSYRNGIAKVNENGELLAVSDYLLVPHGINEEYGDRAKVIFGDGLVIYKNHVLWIGGMSDYSIGIFIADLNDVMKELKEI